MKFVSSRIRKSYQRAELLWQWYTFCSFPYVSSALLLKFAKYSIDHLDSQEHTITISHRQQFILNLNKKLSISRFQRLSTNNPKEETH